MAVGGGTGNTISFSEIRDFYGDTNPVVFSDFNRRTSNDGLVDATFAGASTATTTNGPSTKNDFGITQTSQTVYTSGQPSSLITRAEDTSTTDNQQVQVTYTVLASDAVISLVGGGLDNQGGDDPPEYVHSWNSTGVYNSGSIAGGNFRYLKGPAYQTGDFSNLTFATPSPISTGNLTMTSSSGTNSGSVRVQSARRTGTTEYDITFTNNNSTGDTYTLASSSTGHSTKSVYAAGDSQKVKDDSTSNQWTIAYDNVTGSGSGTAGDIGVTVTSQNDAGSVSANGGNGTGSIVAPSLSGISFVSVVGTAQNSNDDSTPMITLKRNNITVDTFRASSGVASTVTYTQAINSNDTFTAQGGDQSNVVTINYTTPSRRIVFQNNGSSSLTIGSNSTGGAKTIAAGNSADAQPGGSTNNASWAVYFDTSSGSCNVGIPTTISSGNSANLNLFNTVTTPIG